MPFSRSHGGEVLLAEMGNAIPMLLLLLYVYLVTTGYADMT